MASQSGGGSGRDRVKDGDNGSAGSKDVDWFALQVNALTESAAMGTLVPERPIVVKHPIPPQNRRGNTREKEYIRSKSRPNLANQPARNAGQSVIVVEDLLGFGYLNIQRGTLLSNESPRTLAAPPLPMSFQRKIHPLSDQFSPELYLSTFHKHLTREQLNTACDTLSLVMNEKGKELQRIVVHNFHRLMLCQRVATDARDLVLGSRKSSNPALLARSSKAKETTKYSESIEKDSIRRSTSNISAVARVDAALKDTEALTTQLYAAVLIQREKAARLRRILRLVERLHHVFEFPERLRNASTRNDIGEMIKEYHSVRAWIAAQVAGSPIVLKIANEVNHVMGEFQHELYRRMKDPSTTVEELSTALDFLGELDPDVDHAQRVLVMRQEKVLDGIRRVRGIAAADVILRRRLLGPSGEQDAESFQEMDAAMLAVTRNTQRLSKTFLEGVSFFWQLAKLIRTSHARGVDKKESTRDVVPVLVSEIVSEYTDALNMILLSTQSMITREAALETVHTYSAIRRLELPSAHLGSLSTVVDDIAREYCLSIVRSIRNVAVEFARSSPMDSTTLPEQLRLLVMEALNELRDVVSPDSETAVIARNACIKANVAAARALYAEHFGSDASHVEPHRMGNTKQNAAVDTEQLKRLLITASCVHLLAERVIPQVGEALSVALGGDGFAPVVNSAVSRIHAVGRVVVERYAHLTAAPLVNRVIRGVVAGGALKGSLRAPRSFTRDLLSELVLIASRVRATARPRIVEHVMSLLKTAIGNAFRDSLLDLEDLGPVTFEQLLLEIEFVEHVVAPKSKVGYFVAAKRLAEELAGHQRSSDYFNLLDAAVAQSSLEQHVLVSG